MATEIKLGPDGPAHAGEMMGIGPSMISGATGGGAQRETVRPTGSIGVPVGPPVAKKEKSKFVPNMLRIAVEEKWGHHYGYFDALKANDLDERHVLYKGQRITIPARARRAKMVQATKWRRYFGSS